MTGYTFNQLFDFTRTTAGTFVGSNGLLQTTPASVNLLTFTQEFDNAAWVKGAGATVVANNQIAPDGTSTADTITFTAGGAAEFVRGFASFTVGLTYTVSVYARLVSGTPTFIFDVGNGAAVSGAQVVTSTWQRFSFTFTFSGANQWFDIEASATGSIAFWGAQLELGSTATTYARNNGGRFPPRFEYDPVTRAPRGFLIEEQRTNFEWSQDLDNAFWTKSGASVAVNTTTAPDGTTTADKLVENTATSTHFAARFPTIAAATNYSFSVYIKAAGRTFTRVLVGDTAGANGVYVDANLATGATATGTNGTGWTLISASATAVGNGWFRIIVSGTNATATTGGIALIYPSSASGVINYLGDGVSGLFVWGAQFETGTFATSYIPTSASQVTRSADVCTISAPMFAPWYVQSEGTFVVDYDQIAATASQIKALTVSSDGTSNNRIYGYIGTTGLPNGLVTTGGVIQANPTNSAISSGVTAKTALAYKIDDFALVTNGGTVATDTSGSIPAVNRLDIGWFSGTGSNQANGHIRRITYYPFRASNNQLQVLTT